MDFFSTKRNQPFVSFLLKDPQPTWLKKRSRLSISQLMVYMKF
uniref:Uncharacterized protein n=1 Tax=Arundo donax TaxID=35708 RepID=A0A0A9FDU0_ARUDO